MEPATEIAYIGLGSNLHERESYLHRALQQLHGRPHVRVERCSWLYETDPVGYTEQPLFLNMAVAVRTQLSARELLDVCMDIERELGRTRAVRWGPRTIDLDILLYGECRINETELCVPHPRMKERLFVLIPLLEILPVHAAEAASCRKALEKLEGKEGVRKWKQISGLGECGSFGKEASTDAKNRIN